MNWDFPLNGGGETDGFNNSSIDTFIGRRVFSLVRETIQNSMDARSSNVAPVRVAFTFDNVEIGEAIGITELLPFLKRAKQTAINQHGDNHPGSLFFNRAINLIEHNSKVPFFGIHDFNTAGLTGPLEANIGKPGPWLALVKGSGLSVKNLPGSLGSFGHGSKAPFAVSQLRTVFYFSKINEQGINETRFQGKSILQSMEAKNHEMTQGTGYFGDPVRCMPILNQSIPKWPIDIRNAIDTGTGTSIFIPFPDLGSKIEEFWRDIKISVISNFYYAILKGNLEVNFGDEESLTKENLQSKFSILLKQMKLTSEDEQDLFDELRSAITVQFPTDGKSGVFISKTFGEVAWFMRVGDEIDWRVVGIARQNGMLISRRAKSLEKFTGTKPFDMFLCVIGEQGSQILRAAENPAHTEFEFDRITDLADRKKKLAEYTVFTKEIRELIREHASIDSNSEIFIDDLDEFFGGFLNPNNDDGSGLKLTDLVVSKRKRIEASMGSPIKFGDDNVSEELSGNFVGRRNKNDSGGKSNKNKSSGGELTSRTGFTVGDPRIVRQSNATNLVKVFFTTSVKGNIDFALYRSGESEREPMRFKTLADNEWRNSLLVSIKGNKRVSRIELDLELHPEDFNYAHEIVVFDGN